MKTEYLLFNIIILGLSTIGCILYKNRYWPNFFAASKSILMASGAFLLWDQIVTNWWWSFNTDYIIGVRIGKLPIEEVLFFLIIPWSCLVIWTNINKRVTGSFSTNLEKVFFIGGFLIGMVGLSKGWWYTAIVGVGLSTIGMFSYFFNHWLQKKAMVLFLGCVIILTIIFNNYLTSRPIVIYEPSVITGLYIGSMPIEDMLYGLILIAFTVMLYEIRMKQDLSVNMKVK